MKPKIIFLSIITAVVLTSCSSNQKDLRSWEGNYGFFESWPYLFEENFNHIIGYEIYIYKEDKQYYANININGHLVMSQWKARVQGDENSIDLILDSFLPDNMTIGTLEIGDTLFTLEREGNEILTYWGELTPELTENQESGKVYFERY